MTPIEHQMMCSVCSDLKKYKMYVNQAKLIRNNLEQIVPLNATVDTSDIGRSVISEFTEHKNAHFMCGQCMKVNKNDLKNEEDKITKLVVKFLAIAYASNDKSKLDNDYYQILRNLRGNYPKIAHNLEQRWFSSVKEL